MAWRDCLKIYRFDAVIASSPNGGKTTPHQHLHFDEVVAPPRRLGVVANSLHLSDQNMLRRPHNRRTAVELHSIGESVVRAGITKTQTSTYILPLSD